MKNTIESETNHDVDSIRYYRGDFKLKECSESYEQVAEDAPESLDRRVYTAVGNLTSSPEALATERHLLLSTAITLTYLYLGTRNIPAANETVS